MSAGGKGDAPRPLSIPPADFAARWDVIFSKKCERCGQPVGGLEQIHTCTPRVEHLPADDTEGGLA